MTVRKNKISKKRLSAVRAKRTKKQVGGSRLTASPSALAYVPQFYSKPAPFQGRSTYSTTRAGSTYSQSQIRAMASKPSKSAAGRRRAREERGRYY